MPERVGGWEFQTPEQGEGLGVCRPTCACTGPATSSLRWLEEPPRPLLEGQGPSGWG